MDEYKSMGLSLILNLFENNNITIEALSFNFINTIRQLTITAFKGSEYIGENVLIYRPIPGEQKGCVDLEETTGGRAWSI